MFRDGLLAGKRILITGGGTGLGKSIGRRYVELGAELVICGRRGEMLQLAADEFARDFGARIETHVCDVRDAGAVGTMMDRIWESGPLDVLLNNAAGNFLARTERLSPRAVDAVIDIVLKGGAYCTIAAGRRWIDAGRGGTVLCILTQSALVGAPFTVPSAMAKAGLLAMIRSLAVEWGPKGIRLVGVAPGPFPTEGAWAQLMPKERHREPIRRSRSRTASPCAGSAGMKNWPTCAASWCRTAPASSPARRSSSTAGRCCKARPALRRSTCRTGRTKPGKICASANLVRA